MAKTLKLKRNAWGFEPQTMDLSVRPQDDFFRYVNGTWLKTTEIEPTESRAGSFTDIRKKTEKQLYALIKEVASKKRLESGSAEQMIRDLYLSGMDMKTRNALGAKPLAPWIKLIDSIKTPDDVVNVTTKLHKIGVDAFWGYGIDQDFKNTNRYLLMLGQSGLGMPDRDYYLNDDPESVRVRTAYIAHIKGIFRLLGYRPAEATSAVEAILRIETLIATASMRKEDVRNAELVYHKKTISQLTRHTPKLKWETYLKSIGAKTSDVNLMQPDFFTAIENMISTADLNDLRLYLTWNVASDFSSLLSDAFRKENFIYAKAVVGQKKMRPLWRQVVATVNGSLDEVVGQLYVERHFSPDAKKRVNEIVDDLFAAYEIRIQNLEWMTPATKRKALIKLRAMKRKIGYPDKWKNYNGLHIEPNDFVGNMLRITAYEDKRQMKKLQKSIDRTEWFMSPQTVNAYNGTLMNEIAFPAAFLQWPFFDYAADDAVNYGAMGMTIGHEITHGFDDEGAKFDSTGNLKTWWSATDKKQFEARTKIVERQFNMYTVADGIKVNGKLTLGENIADLGGLSIAYDAFKLSMARTGRKDIDGYTPEQRFFLGFAQCERELSRPEFEKMATLTDPHAPTQFRVNGPLSNLPEFYEAFGVKKGDGLYRDPKDRAKIW